MYFFTFQGRQDQRTEHRCGPQPKHGSSHCRKWQQPEEHPRIVKTSHGKNHDEFNDNNQKLVYINFNRVKSHTSKLSQDGVVMFW